MPVALRKESVDRNNVLQCNTVIDGQVALRKESVDRNNRPNGQKDIDSRVALRKESVDRNRKEPATVQRLMRRSPQGERG